MIGKENIAAKVVETGGKLSVKSALNPILWLCAIITVPSLIAVPFLEETPIWLIVLIVAPVITAILGFLFLLVFDRDKLQSEDYQLQKRSMDLIQIKGQEKPQLVDTEKENEITNTEYIEVESTKKNQE